MLRVIGVQIAAVFHTGHKDANRPQLSFKRLVADRLYIDPDNAYDPATVANADKFLTMTRSLCKDAPPRVLPPTQPPTQPPPTPTARPRT